MRERLGHAHVIAHEWSLRTSYGSQFSPSTTGTQGLNSAWCQALSHLAIPISDLSTGQYASLYAWSLRSIELHGCLPVHIPTVSVSTALEFLLFCFYEGRNLDQAGLPLKMLLLPLPPKRCDYKCKPLHPAVVPEYLQGVFQIWFPSHKALQLLL